MSDTRSRGAARPRSAAAGSGAKAFPVWETVVTRERQAQYHDNCDVATAVFGDAVDASVLASDCARSFLKARLPIDGLMFNYHKIDQVKRVRLGDVLEVHGRIQDVAKDEKRFVITAVFDFLRDGERVVGMEAITLRPDAQKMRQLRRGTDDEGPKAQRPRDYSLIGRKLLTPEKVQTYAKEAANKINFDAGFAARFGLRSPVAPSLVALTYFAWHLAKKGLPDAYEIDCRFLNPLYWDDGVDLIARERTASTEFKCINARSRIVCEAEFRG